MVEVAVAGDLDRLEVVEQRGPVVPGRTLAALDDVVPRKADIGITCTSRRPSRSLVSRSSCSISRNRSSEKSARSILFTATTTCRIPRIEAMYEWRRVCSITPLRASTRMIATSAVEAPVTMFRVYWTCRCVGELEAAARRHERAVGDVDRDPLLALGAQTVRQEREVDVAVAAALRRLLDVLELVGEDLLRVVEEPADQRRLAVVTEPAVTRRTSSVASSCSK